MELDTDVLPEGKKIPEADEEEWIFEDDEVEEEIKDINAFYANRKSHKTGSLKELLKDID